MAGSLLQSQESQVLCVVAGWHLAHFETHLMGPRNYPTFPHSWHLPTASTDTTGVFARDWGRGAAHADEAIKTVGARDSCSSWSQERHRRSQCLVQWGPAGTKTPSVPPTQEAWDALRGTPASYTEPSETEGNAHTPQFRVLNSSGNQVLRNWMGSKNIHDLRSTAGKFLDNKHHVPKILRSSHNQLAMEIN